MGGGDGYIRSAQAGDNLSARGAVVLCSLRLAFRATLFGKFPRGTQRSNYVTSGNKFHGDVSGIAELAEFPVDIREIDFAGARLVAPGNIRDMHQAEQIDVFLQLGD